MRLECTDCGESAGKVFQALAPYGMGTPKALCVACHEQDPKPLPYERRFVKDFRHADTFNAVTSKRFVGVEFEMFNVNDDTDKVFALSADWRLRNCGISEDGSIESDAGIEVKTPPAQGDDLAEWIGGVCAISKQYRMTVNSSCGLHVHVDGRGMTGRQLRRLMALVRVCEPVIYGMQPLRRLTGDYSRPMQIQPDAAMRCTSDVRSRRAPLNWWHEYANGSHYSGLNLGALNEHGSVEFRYHSGTLNAEKVMRWIAICQAFVDTACSRRALRWPTVFSSLDDRLRYMVTALQIAALHDYIKERMTYFRHGYTPSTARYVGLERRVEPQVEQQLFPSAEQAPRRDMTTIRSGFNLARIVFEHGVLTTAGHTEATSIEVSSDHYLGFIQQMHRALNVTDVLEAERRHYTLDYYVSLVGRGLISAPIAPEPERMVS